MRTRRSGARTRGAHEEAIEDDNKHEHDDKHEATHTGEVAAEAKSSDPSDDEDGGDGGAAEVAAPSTATSTPGLRGQAAAGTIGNAGKRSASRARDTDAKIRKPS